MTRPRKRSDKARMDWLSSLFNGRCIVSIASEDGVISIRGDGDGLRPAIDAAIEAEEKKK